MLAGNTESRKWTLRNTYSGRKQTRQGLQMRKPLEKRVIRIEISLTPEQLQKIDQYVTSSRSALIRGIVRDWINLQEARARNIECSLENFETGITTESDFETTFNAHAAMLKNELSECYHNGWDVSCLVPVFARFMRERIGKQAPGDQILVFLQEKMVEVAKRE